MKALALIGVAAIAAIPFLGAADARAATTAITGTMTCTSATAQTGCQGTTTLSSSNAWALDNVSGFCSFDISHDSQNTIYQLYLTTKIGGVSSIVYLTLTPPGFYTPPRLATVGAMEFSQLLHTYADAGSAVQFNANMEDPDVGTHLTCTVYFQGHSRK